MFHELEEIYRRPAAFERYTAADLWTDEHISEKMLRWHLDGSVDIASRTTGFIDASAAWIIARFGLRKGTSVADFGCGPGLYTGRFARSDADVTGIDFSGRSLKHARSTAERDGLRVEYVCANYLDYEAPKRFDLVTIIMCDFCALSPGQRGIMLDKFRGLLRPGGALLLDVYSLRAFEDKSETAAFGKNLMDGFWSAQPYFGFLSTFKYEKELVTLDKYTIFEPDRTRVIHNWLQYFSPESLASELARHGLIVEEFFGDVAGGRYDAKGHEFAVAARRP